VSEQFSSKITYPFMIIPNKVWEIGLTPIELAVLSRIIFRSGRGGDCFESRESIAKACSISSRSVSNALDALEQCKVISVISRKLEGKTNLVSVNEPAQWISKLQMVQKQEVRYAPDADQGMHEVQTRYARGAHRTRLPEQDSIEQDSFLNTVATAHAAAPQDPEKEVVIEVLDSKPEKQKSAGSLIFEAYQDAYVQRYKIEPLRNAKTNSICSQIAKQLPLDEAVALMHFFVQQNVAFYLQRSHAIQLALGDLQALRTNMLQNKAMSSRQAFLADKQQAQKNIVETYLENREKYLNMFK